MPALPDARPHRWILLLFLSLVALAAMAAEPREVGRVLVASGEVTATREGASTRSLARGDHLYEGDAIITGPGSRVQIRLSDEGLVQLDADTEYRIQRYRAEGEERGAVTELVEGGLRTVTGAIGDDDPDNYQLDTPVATIGIRGTHFALHHSGGSGTVGEVAEGTIVVENDGGGTEVGAGSFFAVRSRDQAPQQLDQRPQQLDTGGGTVEGDDDGEEESEEGNDEEGDEGGEGQSSEGGDEKADDDSAGDGPAEGASESSGLEGNAADRGDGFDVDGEEPAYSAGEDEGSRERAEDEGSDPNTGADGSTDDGTTDDGSTDDGSTDDGSTDDGATDDGSTDDGSTDDGATDDGTTGDGSTGDGTDVEPTPWYEDETLTQFGITGFLGGPQQPPGLVVDGKEHPETGTVQELSLGDAGALVAMTFSRPLTEGGDEEVRMARQEGAEAASRGMDEPLGLHWGRWNLGGYTQEVDGEPVIAGEEDAPPGTDWHWVVLENAQDMMTTEQYETLSGETTFQWSGGTDIRASYIDYETEESGMATFTVDRFELTANFTSDQFTAGELSLSAIEGEPPRSSITLDQLGEGQSLDAGFFVLLTGGGLDQPNPEGVDQGHVVGHFVGENADGAAVTFTIMDGTGQIQGLEGVGALTQ